MGGQVALNATETQQPLPFDFMDYTSVTLLGGVMLAITAMMVFVLWFGWRASQIRPPISLFGNLPLRPAIELSYESIGRVYLFMTAIHQFDNRMFSIHRASVCRATGRIFPNSIDFFGRIHVDWNHLRKRYRGNYVSWGSLNEEQQADVIRLHRSLEGFQTQISSPLPSPRAITAEYSLQKPGPLYVDVETKVLLGWKQVPGTELEVLIVQKPKRKGT